MSNIHNDLVGQEIQKGSFVACNWFNSLEVCVVEKLSAKMVRVRRVNGSAATKHKYPSDCVILDNSKGDITMYILKNSKT